MEKLTENFPWNEIETSKDSRILLVQGKVDVDSEFGFVYLLLKHIKNCLHLKPVIPILLILANHSYSHYEDILRKHGFDLKQLQEANLILVISLGFSQDFVDSNDQMYSISWIDEWIQNDLKSPFETHSLYSVLIDNIDALEFLFGFNRKQELLCILSKISSACKSDHNIHKLVTFSFQSEDQRGWINGAWVDSSSIDKSELLVQNSSISLSEYLRCQADVTVFINPLLTGYSTDIHGYIQVCKRNSFMSTKLLFKALDTGIRCQMIAEDFLM